MRPMLASPGDHVPSGDAWTHEVKWDGVRMLGDVSTGGTLLTTRNENVATTAWPDVTAVGPERDLLVDGEIIGLNAEGLPDFRTLGERIHVRGAAAARLATRVPATYMVFDLLRLDGRMLLDRTLAERRELLQQVDLGGWQVPASYDDGAMLFDATRQQGLEGIVSKRLDSTYRPGERTHAWRKFPHRFRGSFVVGGWRPQTGTTDRLGALLVGEVTPAGLVFRGRVGSGIGPRESAPLKALLSPGADCPFVDEVPRLDAVGTHWVEPLVVVDVDTHGRPPRPGQDGRLRQPSYQGVRTDLSPADLET
ncbi:ATP-dependent DNA ligase [Nocardioides panacihumi]|uniref:DNA ligase (ATP) n=1 Tax=Nocardioides panacihumi TaxID=400774 RepID=A0ABN2R7Y6_9ACTN